ncbi:HD domain-containing protein [Sulfurimonas sp. MAG313]|nr:HD domain-containing protein [Sulfurimonas sp. MAG313]MDF1880848.1 HD domain-containing protein [Sulfurimonas sp. MAG313]
MKLPESIIKLAQTLMDNEARAFIVGGFVRDHFLGLESKDIDIEIYGIASLQKLSAVLEDLAPVHEVGKNFGVLKISLDGYDLDISLPRTETKTGQGHKGFHIQTNGQLDYTTAAKRRDFTMNSIGYDIKTEFFLDPYDGRKDIEEGIIRHVDDKSFVEDPLRVLRAVQFAGRFNFVLDTNTLKLCQNMVEEKMLDELPKERIFEEYKKLLLRSDKPSQGFELLDEMNALYPELKNLQGIPQDKAYHPEGDVWTHTMMSLDAMAQLRTKDEKKNLILMLAVLCHDFGKVEATTEVEGKISSIAHEHILEPTNSFITRLTNEKSLLEEIYPLIKEHLVPSQLYQQKSKDSAIRRLSTRVNIQDLVLVATADHLGRTTTEAKNKKYPAGQWLLQKAKKLKVHEEQPKELLLGRHLIKEGMTPGLEFKVILQEAYDEQLEGKIKTEKAAIKWLKNYLNP